MLFSFLTTEANAEGGAVHEKAMPLILLTKKNRKLWMKGEVQEALKLQKVAPDGTLNVVATGKSKDL